MSSMPFRSSRSDSWTTPRSHTDATLRMMKHGKIQPMHQPSFWERLFGAV